MVGSEVLTGERAAIAVSPPAAQHALALGHETLAKYADKSPACSRVQVVPPLEVARIASIPSPPATQQALVVGHDTP
jgi:hypothetical protein